MKIGLFFGSFNPIHIGHLAIANYVVEFTEMQQLWFIISPQNPFKKKSTLLADYHRLELVEMAIKNDDRFRVNNIEFLLPKPSYTIDTLTYLKEKFSMHDFFLIMGMDNLAGLKKWKNYEEILSGYNILVYPRPGYKKQHPFSGHERIKIVQAPLMEISSSFIRQSIKEGKDVCHFLPHEIRQYVKDMHFYEK